MDLLAGVEYDIEELKMRQKLIDDLPHHLNSHFIDKFEALVAIQPKKPFLIYDGVVYTYEAMDAISCKVANIAKSWGLKPRDCVAIMIENEPSFIWTFYGLLKLGVSVAFINYNLRLHPLIHSILSVDCKALIVGSGAGLVEAVSDVLPQLNKLPVYAQGVNLKDLPDGINSFDVLMHKAIPCAISPAIRADLTAEDTCCYIFTSGTTGKPKPVIFSHTKAVGVCVICNHFPSMCSQDIVYTVLPLYHNTGCFMSVGAALLSGATVVLRKKFSARHFWSDCRQYKVTVVPYIGELLRYLLSQPKTELDGVHNIRVVYGAGLRADIWNTVCNRFKIPKVLEFYGATEGITFTANYSGKPGAIGRLSPILSKLDPDHKVLVKFDTASVFPVRNENGYCIPVKVGEPGLMLSKVPENLLNKNLYKASSEANEKKFVRDAFAPGDVYMNYGDALVQDKDYFLYFYDRLGDTFRWKGENVSTKEVANAISTLSFIEDANVYGVEIPGKFVIKL
ncbi:very long-chain acyl-coa synthetase [Plakobranchus ocellatus]|uniref:Long-chain-fatty-acid--CoA ligase n=1 Tax=Plakobranchus ocellatus TaxID=259542 RepID=A0AAV4CY80_9GAST|nr:very long-chain acyl-coa synthetase [Plakobranchus ocellatus]